MAGEQTTALELANDEAFYEFSRGFRSAEQLALLARMYVQRKIEESATLDEVARAFCLRACDDHHWLSVGRMIAEPFVKRIEEKPIGVLKKGAH